MEPVKRHKHTGTDSEKLYAADSLIDAPQPKITLAEPSVLTTGGAIKLMPSDNKILNNALRRIADIEAALKKVGIIL